MGDGKLNQAMIMPRYLLQLMGVHPGRRYVEIIPSRVVDTKILIIQYMMDFNLIGYMKRWT